MTRVNIDDLPMLLGYQARWFCDESLVKVIEKSRRIGISWASACKHVFVAAEGKSDTWYVGYSEDQGEEFIRDVADWAKAVHGAAVSKVQSFVLEDVDPETGNTKAIKAFRVDFASGCKVTALSSRPRNLRGKQGLVTIDEAAYHEDLRGLLKAAIALLMWGGQVEVISTHNGVDNEFNKLIEEIRSQKFEYSLHRVTLDDALADGLYKRISLVQGKRWTLEAEKKWRDDLIRLYGDGADEELFCVPSKGGALYFIRDVVESRMVTGRPVLRLSMDQEFVSWPEAERVAHVDAWLRNEVLPVLARLPPKQAHYLGQDFGRTADLTVLMPGTLTSDLRRDVPFIIELFNVPFEQQKQVAFFVLDRLPNFRKAHFDASGNGSYLAEVCAQRYGTRNGEPMVEQVKIGENWHMETWPVVRSFLEEGKVLLPADERILSDFGAVKRVNGIPKLPSSNVVKVAGEKSQRRHGDGAVALAMLVAASREPDGASEYMRIWGSD